MKIIIGGAGYIGTELARTLSALAHDVTIIDYNLDRLEDLSSLEVRTLYGSVADPETLQKADAQQADMLLALTDIDEVNMVACQMARVFFEIPTKIASIRSPNYHKAQWQSIFGQEHLAVDAIVSPYKEAAHTMLRRIRLQDVLEFIPFADNRLSLVCVYVDRSCFMTNNPISALEARSPHFDLNIVMIEREGKVSFVASEQEIIRIGDEVYFMVLQEHVDAALALFGIATQKTVSNVLIIGGGFTGFNIAKELEKDKNLHVRLVEIDKKRAFSLTDKLERTLVIQGDGCDERILREVGVEQLDVALCVTNDDRSNLISGVVAKHANCQRAIALIRNDGMIPLIRQFKLDGFVSSWSGIASVVLPYIRRGRIRSLYSLCRGAVEVHEVEMTESSPLLGQRLRESNLPDGIAPIALIRNQEIFLLNHLYTRIEVGDIIIVCLMTSMAHEAENFFRSTTTLL